jgi:hypothetical protein
MMCARVAGVLEWNPATPLVAAILRVRTFAGQKSLSSLDHLCCPFCGGQTYLGEVEETRIPRSFESLPAVRRGRPRKQPIEQAISA